MELFEVTMKDEIDGFDCKDKLAEAYATYRTNIIDISIQIENHTSNDVTKRVTDRVQAIDELVNRLDDTDTGTHVNVRGMNWIICYFGDLVKELRTKLKKYCLDYTSKSGTDKLEISLIIKKEIFVFVGLC